MVAPRLLCVLLIAIFVQQSVALAADTPRKANVIVIVGDDMGYADIGAHGSKQIPTPHLDSLAKNGIRFTSGYVSGPYCSPTRAGLLTGRYQQRFGHEFNPGPAPGAEFGLSLKEVTLADRFKAAGYKTGMVGKWHLGNLEKFNPVNRGFDEFFGFLGGAHSYVAGADGRNPGILRGTQPVEEKEYLTDAFAREAVAYIDRHQKDPFFLYLTFNAVHTPLQAPQRYKDRVASIENDKRRTYAAMMVAMDDAIGAVLKKLADAKIEEDTLIFFVSDNGGPPGNMSNNGELRGHKASTWEGGIRVPFLAQWKGKLPAGKTYDHPVIQLDIFSTALAVSGWEAAKNDNRKIDGVNLIPYLTGENDRPPHEALYWRFGQQMAIRMGDYKLVRAGAPNTDPDAGDAKLFNLAADVGESKDLAAEQPQRVKEMQAKYDAWEKELVAPTWKRSQGKGKNKDKNKAKAKEIAN